MITGNKLLNLLSKLNNEDLEKPFLFISSDHMSQINVVDDIYSINNEIGYSNDNNYIFLSENKIKQTKYENKNEIKTVEDFIKYLNTLSNEELKKEMRNFGIEFKIKND